MIPIVGPTCVAASDTRPAIVRVYRMRLRARHLFVEHVESMSFETWRTTQSQKETPQSCDPD